MKRLALALAVAVTLHAAEISPLAAALELYARGRYAEATAAFAALARTEPDAPVVQFHLGKLAVHRRDYPQAIALLTRAAERAPFDAEITLWLGNAHAWSASVAPAFTDRVRHGRRALTLYRRAVELDPEKIAARFALMNFCRHVPAMLGGGLERAHAQAREIARRDEVAGAHARALLSFHERNYRVAFDTSQLLLEKSPDHYGANFLLGRVAVASGEQRDAARAALHRCLLLTPGENDDPHDDVRALLAQLDGGTAAAAQNSAR